MQSRLKDKNDIKIFILYLLKNVGYALDFSNINDIVVQDGVVNYFDFAECFAELIDAGNIREDAASEAGEATYSLTEQGKQVCDNLQSELLPMIREKSLKSALRLLSFKKRGSISKCSISKLPDGKFIFSCKVVEEHKDILDLNLVVDNKKMLDKMMYNFDERPETVYKGLISVLTGEINYLL